MRLLRLTLVTLGFVVMADHGGGQDREARQPAANVRALRSFEREVFPLIKRSCLPCHAAESDNPSELSLDSYDVMMAGGKHGRPVKAGMSKESILIQKLGATPPFGNRMPLNRKKTTSPRKRLTDEEVKVIADWIDQGAKKN
jgi:uncharacterized membrane protein